MVKVLMNGKKKKRRKKNANYIFCHDPISICKQSIIILRGMTLLVKKKKKKNSL